MKSAPFCTNSADIKDFTGVGFNFGINERDCFHLLAATAKIPLRYFSNIKLDDNS
jgi:hypothetical protein